MLTRAYGLLAALRLSRTYIRPPVSQIKHLAPASSFSTSFPRHTTNWRNVFNNWGQKENRSESATDNPYDMKSLVRAVDDARTEVENAVNTPIATVMARHNQTIRDINAALNDNGSLIFTRTDAQKQALVLQALTEISDFYNDLCASPQFNQMNTTLNKYLNTILASSNSIQHRIYFIKAEEQTLIKRLEQSNDVVDQKGLKTQIELKKIATASLEDYKKFVDGLPEHIKQASEVVARFHKSVLQHRAILVSVKDIFILLGEIERGMQAFNALSEMSVMSNDLQSCWTDVTHIVKTFSKATQYEAQRKAEDIFKKSGNNSSSNPSEPQPPPSSAKKRNN